MTSGILDKIEHERWIAEYVASQTRYTSEEVLNALDKFVADIIRQGLPKKAGDADGD